MRKSRLPEDEVKKVRFSDKSNLSNTNKSDSREEKKEKEELNATKKEDER